MNSIIKFHTDSFINALKAFFEELKVPVDYLADEPASPADVLGQRFKATNEAHKLISDVYALGMVSDGIFEGTETFKNLAQVKKLKADYDGLLIFGVTLNKRKDNLPITRSHLSEITRAFNRTFPYTPVTIIFKYSNLISFANSERIKYKQEWREGEKVGKVSLLKDIDTQQPHRGHSSILKQLVIPTTGSKAVKSFTQLYYYWQSVFSISVLNKNFYEDIIAWFNNAVKDIKIPDQNAGSEKHKDFTVRLIARLIFIWFLKELKVVKDDLLLPEFDNGEDNNLIKPKSKGTAYYKFILQNLFFNALNSEKKDRDKKVFDVYAANFADEKAIKEAIFFSPYLNGGLFDIHPNDWCESGKVNNAFAVPDLLFLDKEKGLNSILARYKFTIAENTPLEEEIAVDPEMLGRIFENLLAEQSDDTKEAARKNAGAFYTPRPVVSYMCRSTLLKHLDTEIKTENSKAIIHKLLETTVLDPACGSGAFPMGMLEEMMQVLTTVDPEGKVWVAEMMKSKDEQFREHISEMFADGQIRYVKKLGLLRSCLFGVDLLEYAIEITKLRCWLSLIVEQRVDFSKENYNLKPLPNLEFKFYKKNSLFRFYKDKNLNELIDEIDNDKLLKELVNLENQYFIAKSDRHGTKEEIKDKIVKLLEKVVDRQSENITKQINSVRAGINHLVSNGTTDKEIAKHRKKEKVLAEELGELAIFKNTIKDYFIERVVFPGIFNKESKNPGFDIVIGNPPYVNTKLISSMGISKKLDEEYGYCDDLYNHFTFRGLELLKSGGLLSYITSDTFLTLQTKKNIRMEFLGIPTISKTGDGLFSQEEIVLPECQVMEIINTPKAFAALVDTAIFTVKKERAIDKPEMVYVDIRKPNAESFNISEEEWKQVRTSKENLSGWERILDRTFSSLGHDTPKWKNSHTCDGDTVFKDDNSTLLKFKVSFEPYRKAINYAIFSPTEYNSQILEKIIKPARPVFDTWWSKIETSRQIENNRASIKSHVKSIKPNSITLTGLLTDGGQGLATGNNGRFVGYRSTSRFAERCKETRVQKLWKAIHDEPKIKRKFDQLSDCGSIDDVKEVLGDLKEIEIWELFDGIKEKFGLRVFGKGFIYRIISDLMIFDVSAIKERQKLEGITGKKTYVPYDKGDREGNRWYAETPYLIDWSEEVVVWLKSHSGHSGVGMPVVRNPQFYFRNGFCWSDILNPNSSYIKCRLKGQSVNDVKSMSLYDESGLGDKYLVTFINSYLGFKIIREFLNNTVAIQMNDIRKLPIKIPSEIELKAFNRKFDDCITIKKEYFAGEIDRAETNTQLRPIEDEIDEMVNKLYGIAAKNDIVLDEFEEEVFLVEEPDID
ncbi:Eco57I restriction-modification methylase domain-containing protein [Pedobacter frigiditerrae]|uniref:Eco57I restriction-modification methylase domain-containing protein n=1 Tax=Pedobacter frigiditerrae TaxID=2530452 RepID=UPI002930613E|nr:N-6 DNA methylase [Pedobacter frigiditerrae]